MGIGTIVGGIVVLGLIGGGAYIATNPRLVRQLTEIMGEPPLVAIPYIDNDEDRRRRQHAFGYSVLAATAAGIMVLVYLHYMLQPLDVIFFLVLNKLGLS